MSRIFLSHSSNDNASSVALRDWLMAHGWDDVFLDLDPKRGIAAGDRWERALNQAALRCEAVLFLVSRHWLASDWCLKEFNLAHRLNKRLFGLLIEDIPIGELPATLTDTWQLVQLASGRDHTMLRVLLPGTQNEVHVTFSQDGLNRLRAGLERAGLDARFFSWPPANDPNRPPYRGLLPLESGDAGIFFGREAPTVEALDRIRGIREGASPRFLVLLGASGAGKSSFLRAGLLPRLTRDERNYLTAPIIRPEQAAITGEAGLLRSLETTFSALGVALPRADIRSAIEGGAVTLRPLLRALIAQAKSGLVSEEPAKCPILVLAIDQGEELFLTEGAAESSALLGLLRELLIDDGPSVLVIVTIRSDSYEQLQTAKALDGVNQQTMSLAPMPRGAYQAVIEGPAIRLKDTDRRLVIDPTLTEALLADIEDGGGRDALPLLAFTLERLYLEYGGRGRLAFKDYDALGRIKGSIEAAVERAFAAANNDTRIPRDREARLALLRRGLIPWLAGIDPDTGSPRRQKARVSEIPEEARPLINLLVEQRLLSTDFAEDTKERIIEPAHEALLRQWGSLQGWLREDFVALSTLETVKRAARDWAANAEREDWLAHRAGRLEDAERLLGRADLTGNLGEADRQYLVACRAKEQAEQKAKTEALEHKLTMQRRFSIAAVLAALIMAGIGFTAYKLKIKADAATVLANSETSLAKASEQVAKEQRDQALLSESRFLSQTAQQVLEQDKDPATALALALEALPDAKSSDELARSRPYWEAAEASVNQARRALREEFVLAAPTEYVNAIAVTPDGARIVTGSYDRTAQVWDGKTGAQLIQVEAPAIASVAITPDGSRFVTASTDGVARVWDARSGAPLARLVGHTNRIDSVSITDDGARIVTVSWDGTARVWDIKTGAELNQIHIGKMAAATIFPDGSRVVTSGNETEQDGSVHIWDVKTGAEVNKLSGHIDRVNSLAVTKDGTRIVTGSSDKTARLWDVATGKELVQFRGHTTSIDAVAVTPDGRYVLTGAGNSFTGSSDAAVRIWDAASGVELSRLTGHTRKISSLAVTADGKRVISGALDGTARAWRLNVGTGPLKLEALASRGYYGTFRFAMAPDGSRVVASGQRGARIWDIGTGSEIAPLNGHTDGISRLIFTPGGDRIVSGSLDGTVRIWDARTGATLATLSGHTATINDIAIAVDGQRIITASSDETVRIWDINTGTEIAQLKGRGGEVRKVAVTPDGKRIVTSSQDQIVRIWDAATYDMLSELKNPGAVHNLIVTPDSSRIITTGMSTRARIWDAGTGSQIAVLGAESGDRLIAVTPDGARVITALVTGQNRPGKVQIWDVKTGALLSTIGDHLDWISALAVTPDGRRIVVGSGSVFDRNEDAVRIWDVSSGSLLDTLQGPTGLVGAIMVTPDGKHLVSDSGDASVRIWDIYPAGQELVEEAQHLAPRCLSLEQRRRFHLTSPTPNWCRVQYKWPSAGDAYMKERNLPAALDSYRVSLAAAEDAAKANPKNTVWQQRVARLYQDVGNAETAQGHNAAALVSYQAGLAVDERMAEADPGNFSLQNELSIYYDKLGAAQFGEGDLSGALGSYQARLAIRQRIAKSDSSNLPWQDKLAGAYYDVGQTVRARGNMAASLEAYQAGLEIAEVGAKSDPKNDQRQAGLASWHEEVGSAQYQSGDVDAAIRSYEQSLAIRQGSPSSGGGLDNEGHRKLASTLTTLAYLFVLDRHYDEALRFADKAIAVAPDWIALYENRAHALMFEGNENEAKALYLKYRGQKNVANGKSWEAEVLGDFAAFRKSGLTVPLMDDIEKTFSQVSSNRGPTQTDTRRH